MISHISAGLVAVLVGYTSSVAIVFQAAHAAAATPAQIGSWLWALGIGMGATCIGLSWWTRTPILTAWSTPGAALLAASLQGLTMSQAVGVFIVASALIALTGMLGLFDRLMRHVPATLGAAMLAGVLLKFGLQAFAGLQVDGWLVLAMMVTYGLMRRPWPRYAVPLTLLAGLLMVFGRGQARIDAIAWQWATPVWTPPEFDMAAIVGVAVPLYVVTMASQNVPGLAVLRANGYGTPASPLIGWTGLTGVLLAPFGGYQFNLAAITAAICMSPDADPEPSRRYQAAIWAGAFYVALGMMGATVASLFAALPSTLVMTIAGLALLPTIADSLHRAVQDPSQRDAAVVTFLVTACGVSIAGIASAFWGLILGLIALHAWRPKTAKP